MNLFNGNLIYRIPVGTPVTVGPKLAIAPTLVYNSNYEKKWLVCKDRLEYVTGDRAVGAGWRLHFGRLIPVSKAVPHGSTSCEPPSTAAANSAPQPMDTMISTGWGFEEPDGAVHEFFDRLTEATCDVDTCEDPHPPNCFAPAQRTPGQHCFAYSHDGSYLRLDPIDPEHGDKPTVYFPDGTFHVLGHSGGRYPLVNSSPPTDLDFAYEKRPHNTTLVGDLHGNQYTVQYYGDGTTGSPPQPLAAAGVPDNQRDALPYRAFPSSPSSPFSPLFPAVVFRFEYDTVSYVSERGFPAVVAPRLARFAAPSASADGSGGWREAIWTLSHDHALQPGSPRLTRLELPTLPGQDLLDYLMSYGPGSLSSVRLPTLGRVEYGYGPIVLWAQQPSHNTIDPLNPEYKFAKDYVTGVTERRTYRLVQPADGSASFPEESRTVYQRSYRVEDACSTSSREDCRLRVDVWSPRASGTEPFRVTRTIHGESDLVTNAALYGRALEVRDYELYVAAPERAAVDAATPYRTTAFSYHFDGPVSPTNPGDSLGAGTNHNTRESGRTTTWGARSMRTAREGWDGFGHWGTTIEYENTGSGEAEVRRTVATYLNSVSDAAPGARWILDPERTRTVSRPRISALDPSDANLSSTETNEYDSTGFRTSQLIGSTDLGQFRLLTRTWAKGSSASGRCLWNGATSTTCSNLGLPTLLVESLSGSLDGGQLYSTYQRSFYYRYGTLAAAHDLTGFYATDRDVAPNGLVVGERGTEGRTSLGDTSPQLTTVTTFDLLGRPIAIQPPSEGKEELTWGRQSLVRVKRDGAGAEVSRRETYFDQLGRASAERVRLPGNEWSCRITTYDGAGRRVGLTEWRKDGEAGAGSSCVSPLNVQAVLAAGPEPSSTPSGSTWAGFDALGRARRSRLADGSVTTDDYEGWWRQTSSRTVNTAAGEVVTAVTEVVTDRFGQVVSVKEPATSRAGGAAMNPAETTTYRYDHMGRLIAVRKPGSDSNAAGSVTQLRTRSYDDFGWLVSQVDPEEPLRIVTARDARGNPLRSSHGTWQIFRSFDGAGRLVDSRRSNESTTYDWGGNPASWYEVFAYDSLPGFDFGRSNGRLVWSIRANHVVTNHDTVDFGWFGVTSYFHYNGLGGRLGFRQQSDLLMPEPALTTPGLVASLAKPKKSKLALDLERYFTLQGRAAKSEKDFTRGLASENAARSALLGSASYPNGTARWSYSWDSAGRLASVTYPRRDEGFATQASYGYSAGFLTSVNASFQDPFAAGPVGTVTATLSYDASGRVSGTSVRSSAAGAEMLKVSVPRNEVHGLPRPSSWIIDLPRMSGGLEYEKRDYTYDASGNITAISSGRGLAATYLYDARGRLTRDVLGGRAHGTETRDYDGFGNLVRIVEGTIGTDLPTSRSTNRLLSATYDAAGRMIEDSQGLLGRDYYPDGALTAEFAHLPGSNDTVAPNGISIWMLDGRAENALSFWGDAQYCQTEQFRSFLRDENAKILTEYRGETEAPCTCETGCVWRDRFYRDVVRLGPWATASYTRGTGVRVEALDHLGSPRYVTDAPGTSVQAVLMDSFGNPLSGAPATREAFTGHERNHISGDGPLLKISDYMHARTYVPKMGRFTRPDPADSFSLFDPQSLNRYSYVLNNPLGFVDPDGRRVEVAARNTQVPLGTHTYLVITPTGRNTEILRAAGRLNANGQIVLSGFEGVAKRGEIPGNLVKRENDPVDVKASLAKDQKARFTVKPPAGQTMEQFEANVIAAFDSYNNKTEYQAIGSHPEQGTANCNNFSSGLLLEAGVDLNTLPEDLPGLDLGWPVPLERGDPSAKRKREP